MPADKDVAPIIEMRGITIQFPGVKALDNVDFTLRGGEVHSLMGENGAGKSTLIKALTGVYSIDSGTITVAGQSRVFHTTADAQSAGISTVYQEVNLLHEPLRRREPHARPRSAPRRWNRLASHASRGRPSPSEPRRHARHPFRTVQPLDRHAAAHRDQPCDGHRLDRAHPR